MPGVSTYPAGNEGFLGVAPVELRVATMPEVDGREYNDYCASILGVPSSSRHTEEVLMGQNTITTALRVSTRGPSERSYATA